ncbi:hypothetical protein BJ508DRAFT_324825 [Ascobolus immersus RN42]|uniref:Uncharacterized protein n=1 Tax=Ascobolus immersus RN42 TaxID=1160509 RepID=A0A3N4IGD1_ASCIM|nr:hypothetical protein BJ508DRAFT_324825 [Ascobolus immersus RN42]
MPFNEKTMAQLQALYLLGATDMDYNKERTKMKMYHSLSNDVDRKRIKDISLSCFLAFSMVRTPGDVAACHINVKPQHITIYIAKNKKDEKDVILANTIKEFVFAPNARALGFSAFGKKYLEIMVKFCPGKIHTLATAVKSGGLHYKTIGKTTSKPVKDLAAIIKRLEEIPISPNAGTAAVAKEKEANEQRKGGQNLLQFAGKYKGDIGKAIVSALKMILVNIENAHKDPKCLYYASYAAHMIGTAKISNDLLEAVLDNKKTGVTDRLLPALVKFGRYFRGSERLHRQTGSCLQAAGQNPRVDIKWVESQQSSVTMRHSAEDIIVETFRDNNPVPLSNRILADLKSIAKPLEENWRHKMNLIVHCEILLIKHLKETAKLKGGEIGISKGSCGACYNMVNGYNLYDNDEWIVHSNHGNHYLVLPSGHKEVDERAANHIAEELHALISAHLKLQRNAESADLPSDGDASDYQEESFRTGEDFYAAVQAMGLD